MLAPKVDPDALDVRALNLPSADGSALSATERQQNHTLVVNALAAIGCGLPDLRPQQLEEAADSQQVVMQLLWNVVDYELIEPLVPRQHPEFFRLMLPGEEMHAMAKLLPEQVAAPPPCTVGCCSSAPSAPSTIRAFAPSR